MAASKGREEIKKENVKGTDSGKRRKETGNGDKEERQEASCVCSGMRIGEEY